MSTVSPEVLSDAAGVPPGFVPYTSSSPFVIHLGVTHVRQADDGLAVLGVRVEDVHLNPHGMAHGGMLSALIDNAFGYTVTRVLGQPIVTAHLSIDYFEPARPGDWLEAHVSIRKQGRRLCFADCELKVDERVVARGNGVLAVISR